MNLRLIKPFAVDEMLEAFKHPMGWADEGDWAPPVDIEESDTAFTMRAELPGVMKKDVNVKITGNVLTITGEKRTLSEDTKKHRVERTYGSFIRSFTLPEDALAEDVSAKFEDGILSLSIEKTETAEKEEVEVMIDWISRIQGKNRPN